MSVLQILLTPLKGFVNRQLIFPRCFAERESNWFKAVLQSPAARCRDCRQTGAREAAAQVLIARKTRGYTFRVQRAICLGYGAGNPAARAAETASVASLEPG